MALNNLRAVVGWRQPNLGPTEWREKKALIAEEMHLRVWFREEGEQDRTIPRWVTESASAMIEPLRDHDLEARSLSLEEGDSPNTMTLDLEALNEYLQRKA